MDNPNAFAALMRECEAATIPPADYAPMQDAASRYLAANGARDLCAMLGLDQPPAQPVHEPTQGASRHHSHMLPRAHKMGALL